MFNEKIAEELMEHDGVIYVGTHHITVCSYTFAKRRSEITIDENDIVKVITYDHPFAGDRYERHTYYVDAKAITHVFIG